MSIFRLIYVDIFFKLPTINNESILLHTDLGDIVMATLVCLFLSGIFSLFLFIIENKIINIIWSIVIFCIISLLGFNTFNSNSLELKDIITDKHIYVSEKVYYYDDISEINIDYGRHYSKGNENIETTLILKDGTKILKTKLTNRDEYNYYIVENAKNAKHTTNVDLSKYKDLMNEHFGEDSDKMLNIFKK